jgi:hypothetical protein
MIGARAALVEACELGVDALERGVTGLVRDIVVKRLRALAAVATTPRDALDDKIAELDPDQIADIKAHIRGLQPNPAATYPAPAHGWTCFHCGETFRTPGGARLHFGERPGPAPACVADPVPPGL